MTGDHFLARELARDYRAADLEPGDRALLDYAVELTVDPGGTAEGAVERLREVGFDDTAILDLCQVTAYYNFVNRLANGLGVELEASWSEERLVVSREEFERWSGERRARGG